MRSPEEILRVRLLSAHGEAVIEKPSTTEIREYADAAGVSVFESKKVLIKKNLKKAIADLPYTSVELREVLTAIVSEIR